ncbi:MAG: hypothetical protein M2R45_03366 [Verrucomicrobia subdivision 3 bacterium]|nr:hypothetical protein [Limisphaerales bacterium]MCS1416721.1 hypothetical protein [Limisphaerales bacterium]
MLSNTYRQTSYHNRHNNYVLKDPENRLLWHFHRQRLNAEALRDSMLITNDQLNRKMGGPNSFPTMSPEALKELSRKGSARARLHTCRTLQRNVYIMTPRSLLLPLMTDFDLTETPQAQDHLVAQTAQFERLRDQSDRANPPHALVSLCHVPLNTNEFL